MKIYESRYKASKENPGKVIVKVEGGYMAIGTDQYAIWKRQK